MGGQVKLISKADLSQLAVIFGGAENYIDFELYDSVDATGGVAQATTIQFFSNTLGAQGVAVTNMEAANQLISGKQFLLERIELDVTVAAVSATTLADFLKMTHAKSSYTFKINQVIYKQGLLKDLIGGGLFGFVSESTTAADISYVCPKSMPRMDLNPAVLIPTQTNFTFQIDYAAAQTPTATVTLRPKLVGKLTRLASA